MLIATYLLIFSAASPAQEQRINYPGNLELIYLGWQNTPPQGLLVKAHSKYFIVFDGVTAPSVHSIFLLENTIINEGEDVLDIGTGSGIQAVFAAQKARRVVATDIDTAAVKNARYNIDRYELDDKIDLREGDLFTPIKDDEKFDVIIFNLVYPFSEGSRHLWEAHKRFLSQVTRYLKPNGRIYYQAGLIENIPTIHSMVKNAGLSIVKMNMVAATEYDREPIVFVLKVADKRK